MLSSIGGVTGESHETLLTISSGCRGTICPKQTVLRPKATFLPAAEKRFLIWQSRVSFSRVKSNRFISRAFRADFPRPFPALAISRHFRGVRQAASQHFRPINASRSSCSSDWQMIARRACDSWNFAKCIVFLPVDVWPRVLVWLGIF